MAAAIKTIFGVSVAALSFVALGCASQSQGEVRNVEGGEPVAKEVRSTTLTATPKPVFSDATLRCGRRTIFLRPDEYITVVSGSVPSPSGGTSKFEKVAYEISAGQLTFKGGVRAGSSDQRGEKLTSEQKPEPKPEPKPAEHSK